MVKESNPGDQDDIGINELLAATAGIVLALLLALRLIDGSASALVQRWYIPLLAATAVAFFVLGAAGLVRSALSTARWRPQVTRRGGAATALVLVPLILGLVLEPAPLGSAVLEDPSGVTDVPFSDSARSGSEGQRNVYQWAYQFQSASTAEIQGQPVEVIGFVYKAKDTTQDRFFVARFVVACCVADAIGVSLPVTWKDAAALNPDSWVEVKGTVGIGPDGLPIVIAREVNQVATPSNPYIYP